MAIKKQEIYAKLWQACNTLRGGMEPSEYKNYILSLLFMKYLSDKKRVQKEALGKNIEKDHYFEDLFAATGKDHIGETINKVFGNMLKEENLLDKITEFDFNDEKKFGATREKVDKLSKLVTIFHELDLSKNHANNDDLIGDAYEFLMANFAVTSGKSKGEFYTPSEVSQILAKIIGIDKNTKASTTVYDPTCGSGSLLLKASYESKNGLSIYGQEIDYQTASLAQMNTILHNAKNPVIETGNTLSDPKFVENHKLKQFDFIVANPPFSLSDWKSGIQQPEYDTYNRFVYGVPPNDKGDYSFLLHCLASLKSTGTAAIVLPHGVLFRSGSEGKIRRKILEKKYIKGIISLPANLFYGTGIAACIIVLDKKHAKTRESVFMIDASENFIKVGKKNYLLDKDVKKMITAFTEEVEIDGYSRKVNLKEIIDNNYNLNIPAYISQTEETNLSNDLFTHVAMRGGEIENGKLNILNEYWEALPSLQNQIFTASKDPKLTNYSTLIVDSEQVRDIIFNSKDFQALNLKISNIFQQWAKEIDFFSITTQTNYKEFALNAAEKLFAAYKDIKLISQYDIYQIFMNYYHEVLQDDLFMIISQDWDVDNELSAYNSNADSNVQTDLILKNLKLKADIIYPKLLTKTFFSKEEEAINDLQAEVEEVEQEISEFIALQENNTAGDILQPAINNEKLIKAKLSDISKTTTTDEEKQLIKEAININDKYSAITKKLKAAQTKLEKALPLKYSQLTIEEKKEIIIHQKWLATLEDKIQTEFKNKINFFIEYIDTLEDKYKYSLPELEREFNSLQSKVNTHLKNMGLIN